MDNSIVPDENTQPQTMKCSKCGFEDESNPCQICAGRLTGEEDKTLNRLLDRYEAIINEEQGSPWKAINQALYDMTATRDETGRSTIHRAISAFI